MPPGSTTVILLLLQFDGATLTGMHPSSDGSNRTVFARGGKPLPWIVTVSPAHAPPDSTDVIPSAQVTRAGRVGGAIAARWLKSRHACRKHRIRSISYQSMYRSGSRHQG